MINFIHDSMTFSYTKKTLASNAEIVGFYVDHAGFMHGISRNSLYGSHIANHAKTN